MQRDEPNYPLPLTFFLGLVSGAGSAYHNVTDVGRTKFTPFLGVMFCQ